MTETSSSLQPGSGSGRAIFTVDLEEYFQVEALREWVPRGEWESLPSRAGWALDRCLACLDDHDARATFFVARWLLEAHPELPRRVVEAGHEAAVLARPPAEGDAAARRTEFRRLAREARERLEEITGQPPLGYRTSRFAHPIPPEQATEILSQLGYRYDSTLIDPTVLSRRFGIDPDAAAVELPAEDDGLLEVPPTVCSVGRHRLFTVGGTAFRVLPESVIHRLLARDATPTCGGVFYMRSWEFDPEQPVLPVPFMSRVRLYRGLDRVEGRLRRLLDTIPFDSVAGALGLEAEAAEARAEGEQLPGPSEGFGESGPDRRRYRRHG